MDATVALHRSFMSERGSVAERGVEARRTLSARKQQQVGWACTVGFQGRGRRGAARIQAALGLHAGH